MPPIQQSVKINLDLKGKRLKKFVYKNYSYYLPWSSLMDISVPWPKMFHHDTYLKMEVFSIQSDVVK